MKAIISGWRNYWYVLLKKKTEKTEIDDFLSFCLKFDMKEMRISFFYIKATLRSSRLQMFSQKGALKNFTVFTEKHPCWSLFLIKLQAFISEKKLQCKCFPVNTAKCFKNKFYRRTLAASVPWMDEISIFIYIESESHLPEKLLFPWLKAL